MKALMLKPKLKRHCRVCNTKFIPAGRSCTLCDKCHKASQVKTAINAKLRGQRLKAKNKLKKELGK